MQEKVKAKKEAKKRADTSGNEEDKQAAKRANEEAKKAVSRAKASAVNEIYDGLETRDGVKKIYSLAKGRNKATKDLTQIKQIKSETGEVLSKEQEIKALREKAYDRVPRDETWKWLREAGFSEKYMGLIQDMYGGARTLVRTSFGEAEMFPVTVGLHQGSSPSPYIFDIIMEELGRGIIEPAQWDLLFADNIVIISTTREGLQQKIERWRRVLEDRGLKMSRKKTGYMVYNGWDESGDVCLFEEKLKKLIPLSTLVST